MKLGHSYSVVFIFVPYRQPCGFYDNLHSNVFFIFQDIRPMRDQIVRVKRFEKVPLILVGNKVDLESEREVAGSDGRALAQEWGCPFIETSAKSKTMVDELFAEIVRQMNYSTLPEKQEQCCTACVVQ